MVLTLVLLLTGALTGHGLTINRTEHVVEWRGYTDQAALESKLRNLADGAPDLASTFSLGKSEQGRELLGLRLAAGVREERPLLRWDISGWVNMG